MSKAQVKLASVVMEQLLQLVVITRDRDLISKKHMADLVKTGCTQKVGNWNMLTPKGLRLLIDLNLVDPGGSTAAATESSMGNTDENADEVRHEGFAGEPDSSIDRADDQT